MSRQTLLKFLNANPVPRSVTRYLSRKAMEVFTTQVTRAMRAPKDLPGFIADLTWSNNDLYNMGDGKEEVMRRRYYPDVPPEELIDVADALAEAADFYKGLLRDWETLLSAPLRSATIRIAADLEVGDPVRRKLLSALAR